MRALPALALFAVAALVAGCSGGGGSAEASPPRKSRTTSSSPKRDVAWLVLLREWRLDLGRQTSDVIRISEDVERGTGDPSEVSRLAKPLLGCQETLEEKVGEPNAPHYRRNYGFYLDVCDAVSDWARALEDSAPEREVAAKEKRVETLFDDADLQLEMALLALKPLPTIGGDVSRSRIEPRFGRALSKLAYSFSDAAAIEVRCWSKEDWPLVKLEWGAYIGTIDFAGFAYDGYRVSIAPEYCASLVRLVYERERPTEGTDVLMTAASVGLLAHEGRHLFWSETNEARTECYAAQRVRELAPILGTSRRYADRLAEVYWKHVYPSEPAAYRTSECRNGGPLDIHPKTDVWP